VYSRGLVAMQLRTAGWAAVGGRPVGRAGEKVLNSLDVHAGVRANPILGGSRHKSDRIFIDAKLAISSPVTIPELCISLGDSRSEVYPSRLFPSRSPTRSALFHAESFLPFPPSPPPLPQPPRPLPPLASPRPLVSYLAVSLLRKQPSEHCTSRLSRRIATPFRLPYRPHPFSAGNVTYWSNERVEKETIPSNPTNHGERAR
jgi:hypothetical protein